MMDHFCTKFINMQVPTEFPPEYITIDVFHCRSIITRRMMDTIRNFLKRQDPQIKFDFSELL